MEKKRISNPIIVITCCHARNRQPDQYMLAGDYVRAVKTAGGIPLLFPALARLERPLSTVCAGLLLSGGGDFDPSYFNEEPHPKLGTVDRERDCWEIMLIRRAHGEGLPILGICRGMQALNLAFGGSLYQDLPSQYQAESKRPLLEHAQALPGNQVSHRVAVDAASLLFSIVGSTEIWTNTHHHQGVKEVGSGLKIVARSDDGVIEGIEGRAGAFLLGVQWHPERLATPASQRLFAEFVRACVG
jgi:putative glutamine amidotransferase